MFNQPRVMQVDESPRNYHEVMQQRKEAGGLPRHLAIIMDGNRRYAKALGKPSSFGHLKGKERLEQVRRCMQCRSSSQNELTITGHPMGADICAVHGKLKRASSMGGGRASKPHVAGIGTGEASLSCRRTVTRCERSQRTRRWQTGRSRSGLWELWKLCPCGCGGQRRTQRWWLCVCLTRRIKEFWQKFTARGGEGGTLTICIGYGGRQELLQAGIRLLLLGIRKMRNRGRPVKHLAQDFANGTISLEEIDEGSMRKHLYTSEIPGADISISLSSPPLPSSSAP
eukprot:749841-Hanusia_phi.AAC.2